MLVYNGTSVQSIDFATVKKGDVIQVVQRYYGVNKWFTYRILGNGDRRIRVTEDSWGRTYRSLPHDSVARMCRPNPLPNKPIPEKVDDGSSTSKV